MVYSADLEQPGRGACEGLSRLGWPVGVSVGEFLDWIGKPTLTVGDTMPRAVVSCEDAMRLATSVPAALTSPTED